MGLIFVSLFFIISVFLIILVFALDFTLYSFCFFAGKFDYFILFATALFLTLLVILLF